MTEWRGGGNPRKVPIMRRRLQIATCPRWRVELRRQLAWVAACAAMTVRGRWPPQLALEMSGAAMTVRGRW